MDSQNKNNSNKNCCTISADKNVCSKAGFSKKQDISQKNCMVCGKTLEYLTNEIKLTCSYCGCTFAGYIKCPNGHYVCDGCHNKTAEEKAKAIYAASSSTDPLEIFEQVISHTNISMLGCHHASIAAGAFITAVKNEGTLAISDEMVDEIFSRTKRQAIGGYCGLTGVCGIAPALGACFAVILGSKCGTDREQKITMAAVSQIVEAIAELTGPSCCKAYARKSITIAQEFLEKHLKIVLTRSTASILCEYSLKHPHGCRKEKCPYFNSM